MGHRALHAVETSDGRYDCYRSRWDGLAVFEEGPPVPDRAASDATVLAVAAPVADVLRLLDPTADEAVFVHAMDGGVTAYLVCRTGIPTAKPVTDPGEPRPSTALVPVQDGYTAERLQWTVKTAKEVLGDAVDAGLIAPKAAEGYLRRFVARNPDVPDETIWLPREVI